MSYDPRSAPSPVRGQQTVPTRVVQDQTQADQIAALQQQVAELQAALEAMQTGEVLFALLSREPLFLFPELARRGHQWAGNFDETGKTFRIMVRTGRAGQ